MNEVVNGILAVLGAPADAEAVGRALREAARVLERGRGVRAEGVGPWAVSTALERGDCERLKEGLKRYVEANPRGGGAWALSRSGDRLLVPFLRSTLRRCLGAGAASGELLGVLTALEALGERCLRTRPAYVLMDARESAGDAERYLRVVRRREAWAGYSRWDVGRRPMRGKVREQGGEERGVLGWQPPVAVRGLGKPRFLMERVYLPTPPVVKRGEGRAEPAKGETRGEIPR